MGDARLGRAAAVIFARGTGDAVPYLSARLLAGKPLLHYAIEAARRAASVSDVFVSTEDERVAKTARAAGAEVLLRPATLSGHLTPIDAAVEHSARLLSGRWPDLGFLVCVPADAVFSTPASIDAAVARARADGFGRVIGLVPEFKKYVIWKETADKEFGLVVPPPHLRSRTERHFSEPGVLTVWRVERGAIDLRSPRTGYVEIDERQAFRVDTEHDLHVAERIIGPRRAALRCDGSPRMGMGHVMRLLTLSEQLTRGGQDGGAWSVRFFVGSDHLEGARMLSERGLDVEVVRSSDVGHWLKRLEAYAPQVIVTDLPFVPAPYSEGLCDLPAKAITLVDSVADLDPETSRLDTVIGLLDEELRLPHNEYYRGPSFAALHASVSERIGRSRRRAFEPGPVSVLVAYGTGDPLRLTQKTVEAFVDAREALGSLTVVLKKEHQDERFQEALRKLNVPVRVITSPSDRLGELLEESDLAFVSGGITAYEASALGVPAAVLCQNGRELKRMENFERSGGILLLGDGEQASQAGIVRALNRLAGDPELRRRLSEAGLKLSDGRGVERICGIISELLGESAKAA